MLSLFGGTAGAQNGTIMSYCHIPGVSTKRTFGANTNFGVGPNGR